MKKPFCAILAMVFITAFASCQGALSKNGDLKTLEKEKVEQNMNDSRLEELRKMADGLFPAPNREECPIELRLEDFIEENGLESLASDADREAEIEDMIRKLEKSM